MNTEKLKELALAATPGPWEAKTEHSGSGDFLTRVEAGNGFMVCDLWENGTVDCPDSNNRDDALFIAAANPVAILSLIAERDELLAALKLAKEMFISNELVLPRTFEVIDEAIAKAVQP